MTFDKNLAYRFLEKKRKEAYEARENAGYGGRMDDGGCSALLRTCEAFQSGLNAVWPDFWLGEIEAFVKEEKRLADPDYIEYLRLQKKFNNV